MDGVLTYEQIASELPPDVRCGIETGGEHRWDVEVMGPDRYMVGAGGRRLYREHWPKQQCTICELIEPNPHYRSAA